MEAPKPFDKKNVINKPENEIKFEMKSDNKIFYDISIYYLSEKLYIKGISKDKFNKKQYSNEYTLEQIKLNKFFYLHENISEIYDEFN